MATEPINVSSDRRPVDDCAKCGRPHVTPTGVPSCAGHITRDRGPGRPPGSPCALPPLRGATVCANHGGRAPQVAAAAKRRVALQAAQQQLEVEAQRLGFAVEVDPAEAMLAMVCEAAGNVVALRSLVQRLDHGRVGTAFTADLDDQPTTSSSSSSSGSLVMLAGNINKPAEALPHIWLSLYNDERDRLVRWSKACRDAGVDERRVQLAEAQGDQLGRVLEAAMTAAVTLTASISTAAADALRERYPQLVREAIVEVIDTTGTDGGERVAL